MAAQVGTATCAGNEAKGVVARLHVLPEVHVGVVEDVGMEVEVVEALRGQHHAHIITCTATIVTGSHLVVSHPWQDAAMSTQADSGAARRCHRQSRSMTEGECKDSKLLDLGRL